MIEHPDYTDFLLAITRAATRTITFHGVLYRACSPEYANTRDLLTGAGAQQFGGRWNRPESFPVVYLAESVEGAIAETLGLSSGYGFDPASRLPMTLVAIDVKVEHVLDLTDSTVRKTLGITMAEMNNCLWRDENAARREALTEAIGRAAHETGLQGIHVASSVRRTFRNINVFPMNLGATGELKIRRAHKLPPAPAPGVI